MCSPAAARAAALLLAALAALPCRGTDTDFTSTNLNANHIVHNNSSQPTVNKVYLMLHTVQNFDNQRRDIKSNNTDANLIHTVNHYREVNEIVIKECLNDTNKQTNVKRPENAVIRSVNCKDRKRNKKKRTINVIRIDEAVSVSNEMTSEVSLVNAGPSPPPMALERRRRPGETGSSAPLLNYIFDTYSNTHQHKNERPSNGNSIYVAVGPEIEALVGSNAQLDCKVDALHDKLVSWVRRKNDEEPMVLLTTGVEPYTADDRYTARFIPPDTWRLEVREVRTSDAGHYDCQLSAHPPRAARVTLQVPEVSVRIVDGAGAVVAEQVCEVGSTVALRCEVRGLRMEGGPSLLWYRKDSLLNDDTTRGGISVRTEFRTNGADSVLGVARVRGNDAGQYTCTVARSPPPAPPPAHVILHVIKGESLAELHQGGCATITFAYTLIPIVLGLWFIIKDVIIL